MRTLLLVVTVGAILASPGRADAQLVRVTETIYGMDCAPCAYGVERRLGRVDGVREVTLSLNDGYADVALAAGNTVTLDAIRDAIRRSGFSGEGGKVVVRGTVTRANGELEVTTPAGEVFVLAPVPAGHAVGAVIEAAGRVDKDADTRGRWLLRVDDVAPVPGRED